jgi:NAD(P)-dependent dehydrogenase (short-subunit alcohol dehydrogenase family)
MIDLEGKVALVTGAATGIGAATASALVAAGARVAICDIKDAAGHELAASLRHEDRAAYVHLDVTREQDWSEALLSVDAEFGGLDILVNNAGIYLAKDIEQSTLEDWTRICAVNLTGVFLGTKAALPALARRGKGSPHGSAIVNVSSIAGLVGSSVVPLYSMTKGGITTFTKSIALECARKGYRIRVNSIHPGFVESQMGEQAIAHRAANRNIVDLAVVHDEVAKAHPIGRLGTVADIANGIAFLASDNAAFITGASLAVDGGWTAQ